MNSQEACKKMFNTSNHERNAKQNCKISLDTYQDATIKETENNKCWHRCGESEPFCLVSGAVNGAATVENSRVVPQIVTNRITT